MATEAVPTQARSARGAQTRAEILDAAQRLFVDVGYRATSLRDIAAAAGFTHQGVQRHFASKDEILLGVVERFEQENLHSRDLRPMPERLQYVEVARHNAERPGYLELFSTLAGEAAVTGHPAHERMRQRYAALIDLSADQLASAQAAGNVGAGRVPRDESLRLGAAWDGLQLLQLYAPDRVQVVPALARHERGLAAAWGCVAADRAAPLTSAPLPDIRVGLLADEEVEGYAKGRDRRERILSDATVLFAAEGYGGTSMREIAERVGVSKSTLSHYYASKEALLSAVLVRRDAAINEHVEGIDATTARALLESLPAGARANAVEAPGLVEVYVVLSCEAAVADHPAHAYFERRFRTTLDFFTAVFDAARSDGDLPAHRDPAQEAAWLLALWDGLQIQWMYDRDVDVAAHLAAHLQDVLPARA